MKLRHVFRTRRIAKILRRDRRQLDPILQPLHRLITLLRDLGFDVGEVVLG